MSTEQLNWSDSEKSESKSKKDSSKPRYLNGIVGPAVEHKVPLRDKHEGAVVLDDKQHVLPEIVFKQLLNGEIDRKKLTEDEPKKRSDPMAHIPIPVEQSPPPAARAEHPVYSPDFEEYVNRSKTDDSETEGAAGKEEDSEDDEDEDEDAEESKAKDETVVVPLDSEHEAVIPTNPPTLEAIERLVGRLDEENEAAATELVDRQTAVRAGAEAKTAEEPFMALESEPESVSLEGATSAPEYSQSGSDSITERQPDHDEPPVPVAAGGGGAAGNPPVPPIPPRSGAGFPNFGGGPTGPLPDASPASPNFAYQPAFARSEGGQSYVEESVHRRVVQETERQGKRRTIAAGIVGFAVGSYLGGRKRQRQFEAAAAQRFQAVSERNDQLMGTNARLQEQVANTSPNQAPQYTDQLGYINRAPKTHFEQPLYPQQPLQEAVPFTQPQPPAEQFARPGVYEQPLQQRFEQPLVGAVAPPLARPEMRPGVTAPTQLEAQQPAEQMPQVVGEDGQQVVLEPGQRLERRGWYSVVVDEHGREVSGAIRYGGAFQLEQRQEQAPIAAGNTDNDEEQQKQREQQTNNTGGGGALGGSSPMGNGLLPMGAPTVNPMLSSGQADPAHSLPSGQSKEVDMQHRLSERHNPIMAALTNPVLWLAFALLVIAYFIAALI